MNIKPLFVLSALLISFAFTVAAWGHQYTWDPGCECWVPDTSGPSVPDDDSELDTPPDPEPSKFALTGTGVDAAGLRALSSIVSFNHHQPDGVVETREFQYSTPGNFVNRADSSVNLWLVFHGGNGSSSTMHRFFKHIAHSAPTVLVYPEALRVTPENVVTTDPDEDIVWRGLKTPGSGADVDAYRDITFVERLVGRLLINNPQLNGNKVYVSGFSSGGSMTWMLLCYRSSMFAGFGIYSRQLGPFRETEGCGDGELTGNTDSRTGYERLTGFRPDKYGRYGNIITLRSASGVAPTKPVLYIHGTADDNLDHLGQPGCWQGRPPVAPGDCTLDQDPLYSMDYDGPLEQRDDISSVNWLLDRHQLPSEPVSDCTVLDANSSSADNVVTHRFRYDTDVKQPVTWYEMQGAGHAVASLSNSNDFEASLHTQMYFEDYAGMLEGSSALPSGFAFRCLAGAVGIDDGIPEPTKP